MEIKQHTPVHQKKKNHKGNLRYLETNENENIPKLMRCTKSSAKEVIYSCKFLCQKRKKISSQRPNFIT